MHDSHNGKYLKLCSNVVLSNFVLSLFFFPNNAVSEEDEDVKHQIKEGRICIFLLLKECQLETGVTYEESER